MKQSAGLLMYRRHKEMLEFFLVHPGGPYFKNKDEGYWTIPKGEPAENEPLLETAKREFTEETGILPERPFQELGYIKQKGGKIVHAWAFLKDADSPVISNEFSMEWPPKSGKIVSFPEIDKGAYFTIDEARKKINNAQVDFLLRLSYSLINT